MFYKKCPHVWGESMTKEMFIMRNYDIVKKGIKYDKMNNLKEELSHN